MRLRVVVSCVMLSEANERDCPFVILTKRATRPPICHPDRSERSSRRRKDLGQLRASEAGTGFESLLPYESRALSARHARQRKQLRKALVILGEVGAILIAPGEFNASNVAMLVRSNRGVKPLPNPLQR